MHKPIQNSFSTKNILNDYMAEYFTTCGVFQLQIPNMQLNLKEEP